MNRTSFSGGPAYGVHDGVTLQFREDWEASNEIKAIDETTNLQGKVGSREDYSESIIKATPIAFTPSLAAVFAKLFKFGGKVGLAEGLGIGKLLFPGTDLPFVIQTSNGGTDDAGQSLTFAAVAAQQPPELTFGANMPLFGECEWSGLRKNNTAASDAAAHVVVADSAYAEPSFSPGDINNTTYTMSWGASGAPFTGIECDENGVKVKITYSWKDLPTWRDGVIQRRLTDVQVEVRFTPINFDAANFYNTFLQMDGASAGRGKLMAARGLPLTIMGASAGDPKLILPSCVPVSGATRFGGDSRVGEVTLRSEYGFASTISVTTANGDATVTVGSTATMKVGMKVTGEGIPNGATVLSITDATHFELSANATATATVDATLNGIHPLFILGVVG